MTTSTSSSFNTQPPEGGWLSLNTAAEPTARFQHTAARRRLGKLGFRFIWFRRRFNTQPPEGGWPRAAGQNWRRIGFNTQPPEGGWGGLALWVLPSGKFQHTAARRRLAQNGTHGTGQYPVSTHSRPKAAGRGKTMNNKPQQFQHTAARRRLAAPQRKTCR